MVWRSPTALESPLVCAHEFWVYASCPALRESTVSYVGVAHISKNCLEYSTNFWSQPKKISDVNVLTHTLLGMKLIMKHHMYIVNGKIWFCVVCSAEMVLCLH